MVGQFAGPMLASIEQADPAAVDDALATLAGLCVIARSDGAVPEIHLTVIEHPDPHTAAVLDAGDAAERRQLDASYSD